MPLTLSLHDVAEMVSSLLLARLTFRQRLEMASAGALPNDFLLNDVLPALPDVEAQVALLFGVPGPLSPRNLTLLEASAQILCAWQESASPRLTFCTSGSTGQPVPVTHDFALLAQEVDALARLFPGQSRIVSHAPRHHIYGFLFSILLPKALDIPVVWRDPLPVPGLVRTLGAGDLVIGFPLFWRALVESQASFPLDSAGTTSTGPCPAQTIQALCRQGLGRVTEIYGASETSGVGFRHAPDDPYALLAHWRRLPDGGLERQHPVTGGQLCFMPQDMLEWTSERCFRPRGRKDKAVQVAGVNVFPDHVRRTLLEHPGIGDCAVRRMRPEEGERLKALLVLSGQGLTAENCYRELQTWLEGRLSRYEIPGSYAVAERIPTSAMGKQLDW